MVCFTCTSVYYMRHILHNFAPKEGIGMGGTREGNEYAVNANSVISTSRNGDVLRLLRASAIDVLCLDVVRRVLIGLVSAIIISVIGDSISVWVEE